MAEEIAQDDEKKLLKTIQGKFRVDGRTVLKEGDERHYSDGTRKMSLTVPVCETWEHLTDPEGVAQMIADALNAKSEGAQ